jgi:hypothetical protein
MNSKTFIRLCPYPHVKALLAEARRVKYAVTEERGMYAEVRDQDNANALVFRAVHVRPKVWGVTYSAQYWTEET